jgi:hypothetical protein
MYQNEGCTNRIIKQKKGHEWNKLKDVQNVSGDVIHTFEAEIEKMA